MNLLVIIIMPPTAHCSRMISVERADKTHNAQTPMYIYLYYIVVVCIIPCGYQTIVRICFSLFTGGGEAWRPQVTPRQELPSSVVLSDNENPPAFKGQVEWIKGGGFSGGTLSNSYSIKCQIKPRTPHYLSICGYLRSCRTKFACRVRGDERSF